MKLKDFLEYFIIVAIVLVIIQTFLFEFSFYNHWSTNARDMMVYSGFIFDLIFSIEFVVRSIITIKTNKKYKMYFLYERGTAGAPILQTR